jgi:hypothetical protein
MQSFIHHVGQVSCFLQNESIMSFHIQNGLQLINFAGIPSTLIMYPDVPRFHRQSMPTRSLETAEEFK